MPAASRVRAGRAGDRRSQRGAVLVEAALVIPVLIIFIMGVVDFSKLYQDKISLRNGVREAARQGAAARFGGNGSCGLSPVPTNGDSAQLACFLKRRTELDVNRIRVKFMVVDPADPSSAAPYQAGNLLVMCAMSQASSVTGFFGYVLDAKVQRSRMTAMIERTDPGGLDPYTESPLASQNWGFCDPTTPPPS